MTHLLDTSAVIAQALDEPRADEVDALLSDPNLACGVSVLTLYEVWTAYFHRTGSETRAASAVVRLRQAVSEVVPVDDAVVEVALRLRQGATSRLALADCLITGTACHFGVVLVHRDPHFLALSHLAPVQQVLPNK